MLKPASKLNRLINFTVDYLFIIMISTFFFLAYQTIFYTSRSGQGDAEATYYFIYLITYFGYYLTGETIWQRTIGKILTRTRVVTRNNSKPGFRQILVRSWIRTISIDILSFLWAQNGHHDKLTDTIVVKIISKK